MALIGGFYNSRKAVDGTYDRLYSAKDLRKPYDVIYSDGIKPDPDGTVGNNFKVTAANDSGSPWKINVALGHAKLGGAWIENDSIYELTIHTSTSPNIRYDKILLVNDEELREPYIIVESVYEKPEGGITKVIPNKGYQVCLAYIQINPTTTGVTDDMIVDTRELESFCGVMSGVGATVLRTYRDTYFTKIANEQNIPFDIPAYDGTFRSDLTVFIEGRVLNPDQYTIANDNKSITLKNWLPVVGTKVDFYATKNVNGSTASDVVHEVEELDKKLSNINGELEHHYYCTGIDDNIAISNLVYAYNQYEAYRSIRLVIHGNIGITREATGAGTINNEKAWFNFYSSRKPNCRVIVDFSDCTAINIPMKNFEYNVVFYGSYIDIYGAVVIAKNQYARVVVNNTYAGAVAGYYFKAEKCHFDIEGMEDTCIAYMGDFINCYGRVANADDNSWCFNCKRLTRVFGGEFLAYSKNRISAVMFNEDETACGVMIGVNCPQVDLSGYTQDSGYSSYTEYSNSKIKEVATITTMPAYRGVTGGDAQIIDSEFAYNIY